ncbi:hypothetical protein [Embleya sp. NPDC059237]|uniref:hypothetical protein n=1 Tax=Embleya sp. NPDC059237 TaxID=3346784 RepID=UPI0036B2A85E
MSAKFCSVRTASSEPPIRTGGLVQQVPVAAGPWSEPASGSTHRAIGGHEEYEVLAGGLQPQHP